MAAAPIAGISGSFSAAGGDFGGRFAQFTVTSVQDVNDASGFGLTGNWRENLGGMKGYRVSASGYLLSNDSSTSPNTTFAGVITGLTWSGTLSTGNVLSGNIVPTSVLVGHGINGNGTFALEGIGTGPLVETWDETA